MRRPPSSREPDCACATQSQDKREPICPGAQFLAWGSRSGAPCAACSPLRRLAGAPDREPSSCETGHLRGWLCQEVWTPEILQGVKWIVIGASSPLQKTDYGLNMLLSDANPKATITRSSVPVR